MEHLLALISLLILGVHANQRLLVDMTALETLLKTFPRCDVIVITEKVELSNIDRFENPMLLYWSFDKRGRHFMKYLTFGAPVSFRTIYAHFLPGIDYLQPKHPNMMKGGYCKVQVLLDVKAGDSEDADDLFLSTRLESAAIYTLFVHTVASLTPKPELKSSATVLYNRYHKPYVYWGWCNLSFKHVYLVFVSTAETRKDAVRNSLVLTSSAKPGRDFSLLSVCTHCDDSKGSVLSLIVADSSDPRSRRLEGATPHELQEFHRSSFQHVGKPPVVTFSSLEKEALFAKAEYSFRRIYEMVRKAMREESERIKFNTERLKVSPELLLCFELQSKFPNTTIQWLSPESAANKRSRCTSDEYIVGTGHYSHRDRTAYLFPLQIPTEEISLIFVTFDNVTSTSSVVSFATPFDAASWSFALGCGSVLAAFICVALRRTGHESRCLTAVLIIWGIFVENFHDIRAKKKANLRVFAALTLVTSLVGIVLSNGYKGVLTSYLAQAPSYSGPNDVEQILAENWTLVSYTNEWNMYMNNKRNLHLMHYAFLDVKVLGKMRNAVILFFKSLYGPSGGPKKNMPLLKKWKESSGYDPQVPYLQRVVNALSKCNLTQAALLSPASGAASLQNLYLPPSCGRLRGVKTFMVGKESLGPATIGWHCFGRGQEGIVFCTIRKLVEAGIQALLEKFKRQRGEKYKVEDNLVVEPLRGEMPLSLGTPLVESTFMLWSRLLGVALAIWVLEVMCGIFGTLFQVYPPWGQSNRSGRSEDGASGPDQPGPLPLVITVKQESRQGLNASNERKVRKRDQAKIAW